MRPRPEKSLLVKRFLILMVMAFVLGGVALPASAGGKASRLGTDPSGDAPPAVDIIYLDVTTQKKSLDIRIGINGMFPVIGGYPEGPGIEWIFTVGKRTFIAEAVASRTPKFFFFELKGHSFEQLQGISGTYDSGDGFIRMLVPLKLIGAKSGSVIKGFHKPLEMISKNNGTDVDAHVHRPTGGTEYLDDMKTKKDFVVP
jgi:hypothetical protein